MATFSRESAGFMTETLTVVLAREDYYPSFEQSLRSYSKNMNLPGFRKGMVPLPVVKKKFGSGIYTEEVLKLMEKEVNNYLKDISDQLIGQPMAAESNNDLVASLDMNQPQDYTFQFELGLRPNIELPDLGKANLTRKQIRVTDEMVQEEVERLQTRLGQMTEPEAVEQDEDVLNVDIAEVDADGNPVEGGLGKKNDSLLVKYFAAGVQAQWKGKKVGDSLTLTLQDGFEDKERQWLVDDMKAGADDLNKSLLFTLTKIGRVNKRELDEAFFAEALPGRNLTSETELREALREDIGRQLASQTRGQIQDAIYHFLMDETKAEFPEAFLQKWIQRGDGKEKTEAEAAAEMPAFIKNLKWSLISDQFVEKNEIKVSPEELRAFARVQMMGYMGIQEGATEGYEWLDAYVDRMMQDRKYIDRTYNELVTTKLFDALEQQVGHFNIEEVSIEEFNKSMEGQQQ